MSLDPTVSQTIERIFGDESVCLTNIEELIQATEEGTNLIELAEEDIKILNSRVENMLELGEQGDEAEVVREVASILRALDPLISKLVPANSNTKSCAANPD